MKQMDFKKLASIVGRWGNINIDLLINEIELLADSQDVETVDDLTEYLEEELSYFEY